MLYLLLGIMFTAPLVTLQSEEDPKLLEIAQLHHDLLTERDLKIEQNLGAITESRNLLNALVKSSTITQEALSEKMESLVEKDRNLQKNITLTQRSLENAMEKIETLTEQYVVLQRNAMLTQEALTNATVKIESLIEENKDLKRNLTLARKSSEQAEGKIMKLNEKDEALQSNVTEIQRTLSRAERQRTELRSKVSDLTRNVTDLKRKLSETRVKTTTLENQMSTLQTEVDSCAKLTKEGRISQSVLPGSYAEYTLEDVQWQSLHMAAVAACRGATPSNGRHSNHAIPGRDGATCTQVCGETYWANCAGTVALNGFRKQAVAEKTPVGLYYNYGCSWKQYSAYSRVSTVSELNYSNSEVLNPIYLINYCCCRYD